MASAPEMPQEPNAYSARWFSTFLDTIPPEQTHREVEFLTECLPLAEFRRVLDLACGPGRHALALARVGYQVTGWDRDASVLAAARFAAAADLADIAFVERDVRTLTPDDGPFDAVLSMWASFGYFDAATNHAILARMASALRHDGRMVLDVYDAAFFEGATGERLHARGGMSIRERSRLHGDRLQVELEYGDGSRDRFNWQIFRVETLIDLGAAVGLEAALSCAGFDPAVPADGTVPRMQLVFVKS